MHERPPATIVDIDDELRSALEDALRCNGQAVIATREDETRAGEGISDILFELPSDLALLEPVTDYLIKRIEQAWFMPVDRCLSLALALREALVNAITHGNHYDPSKLVRITAEVSRHEARFTVEDEGVGFNVNDVPHPRDPENLLKSSGRGVLLIRSVMDETKYNDRGNLLSMIKRRASLLKEEPMDRLPPRTK